MGFRQVHADEGLGSVSGVVGSLPAGYTLGEERMEDNKFYRLVYNAGGAEVGQGYFATPLKTGAGPFSMTVTTTSKSFAHVGAVLCENVTATTGTYYWGMVRGHSDTGVVGDAASTPTGSAFYIGSDGKANLHPQSAMTGQVAAGINLGGAATKTITTGALSGDVYVNLA